MRGTYRIKFKLANVKYRTLSTQEPTYLVNLLHISYIFRALRSSVSKQPFVPKIKLNIGKCAFSVAAPIIWSQLRNAIKSSETTAFVRNLKHICLKLLFHHRMLVVPCANDNFSLSPCMTI